MERGMMLTQRGLFAQLDNERTSGVNPFRVLSMKILGWFLVLGLAAMTVCGAAGAVAQSAADSLLAWKHAQLVILDTDIGDDIDDAFALALVLKSPEIRLLGITTAYGDTELRARLVDRFLSSECGLLPVIPGKPTTHENAFTQAAYAKEQANGCQVPPGNFMDQVKERDRWETERKQDDAAGYLLGKIRDHPGEITLIAIGPLFNIEAAIKKDPETFRKLKRVVMMGGSINRGYDGPNGERKPPDPEWNIDRDPAGLRALLASGVPVFIMPLDSTQIHLEAKEREDIFAHGSPLTDQLTLLYHEWKAGTDGHPDAPTLYDPVAVAYAIRPDLCPMTPLRLEVDDNGLTRPVEGPPNAQVCLKSDEKGFLELLMGRIVNDEAR
jgi:inosine-uridine nucleoside N-ribohydrolase